MSASPKTVLIIGASRGLGLGLAEAYLAQGWRVIATQRGKAAGALAALQRSHDGKIVIEDLEVTDDAGIEALRQRLAAETIDLLFVSAGVNGASQPVGMTSAAEFTRLMVINALAPMRIIEALADLVPHDGTIAAMTSGLGSIAGNTTGGYEVYRASKAALNMLLRSYAARYPDRAILALHPGWVRTDMGGANAAVGVEESVAGLMAVIAAHTGKAGCFYLDYQGKTIPW